MGKKFIDFLNEMASAGGMGTASIATTPAPVAPVKKRSAKGKAKKKSTKTEAKSK